MALPWEVVMVVVVVVVVVVGGRRVGVKITNITYNAYFLSAIVVPYSKSSHVGPPYNGIRLYNDTVLYLVTLCVGFLRPV